MDKKIGKERKWPRGLPNCFVQNLTQYLTQIDSVIVRYCLRAGQILTMSQKTQYEILGINWWESLLLSDMLYYKDLY